MSHIYTTNLEETLHELFLEALDEDYALAGGLAIITLDEKEYYKFCKEDNWELLDTDNIFDKVLEAYYDCEGECACIKELCIAVYGDELEKHLN